MKKFLGFTSLILAISISAQTKTHIVNASTFLKNITPNTVYDGWLLMYNDGSSQKVVKSVGYSQGYQQQESGFRFDTTEPGKYYIAYSKGGNWKYADSFSTLREFVGSIDNVEEAGIEALANGYFFDTEFKDYSSNYRTDANNYYIEAAKISSEKCPYAKSNYALTIHKKTGEIVHAEDLGVYSKIFDKTCDNNPHNDALKAQMEEAKRKQEEEKIRQKEATEKMRKKVLKRMRKD